MRRLEQLDIDLQKTPDPSKLEDESSNIRSFVDPWFSATARFSDGNVANISIVTTLTQKGRLKSKGMRWRFKRIIFDLTLSLKVNPKKYGGVMSLDSLKGELAPNYVIRSARLKGRILRIATRYTSAKSMAGHHKSFVLHLLGAAYSHLIPLGKGRKLS